MTDPGEVINRAHNHQFHSVLGYKLWNKSNLPILTHRSVWKASGKQDELHWQSNTL